jgi:hypothetical protein
MTRFVLFLSCTLTTHRTNSVCLCGWPYVATKVVLYENPKCLALNREDSSGKELESRGW